MVIQGVPTMGVPILDHVEWVNISKQFKYQKNWEEI
jgi:hypothetical protein